MHPRRRWLLVLAATVALLVAGFALASCGGDDEAPTEGTDTETHATDATLPPVKIEKTVILVRVVDGLPLGGIARATVKQGKRVDISVTADMEDEVHLHGYDLTADVAEDRPAHIDFIATIPGRFEIELENRGVQIADLTVEP